MVAMSKKHLDIPMVYHSKTEESDVDIGSSQLGNEANKMGLFIKKKTGIYPSIAVERNKGQATIARLLELEYPKIFRMKTFDRQNNVKKEYFGWETNKATRQKMLDEWSEAITKHQAVIYSEEIVNEHYSFIRPKGREYHPEAITGKNDDYIICCAGAWQVVKMVSEEKPAKIKKSVQAWDSDFGKMYR